MSFYSGIVPSLNYFYGIVTRPPVNRYHGEEFNSDFVNLALGLASSPLSKLRHHLATPSIGIRNTKLCSTA